MDDSDGFLESNYVVAGGRTSFSKLLLSNDDEDDVGLDMDRNFHCSSTGKSSKMLCFGGCQNENEILLYGDVSRAATQRSAVTCSDSSSVSSGNNNNNGVNIITDSNRKRNRSAQEPVQVCGNIGQTPLSNPRTSRKAKTCSPTSTPHAKMRREKLGDRITALQQLVSPFGKTDTASVLHEAMGYIRFLQDQVQVLCSPYLHHLPAKTEQDGGENGEEESAKQDLKSRGLCLMPLECVVHMDSSNGADYWSPAMGNHFSSSSSTSVKEQRS